jgi:hypothetical protein
MFYKHLTCAVWALSACGFFQTQLFRKVVLFPSPEREVTIKLYVLERADLSHNLH